MAHRLDNDVAWHSQPQQSSAPRESDAFSADDGQSLGRLIHERLSGRWHLAIMLGVVLAVVAALAGYQATTVKYESTGIIHVAPKTNVVMREIPETGMVPRYPSFIQTQATLIASSPRVLERSLQSIELEQVPWSDRLEGVRVIRRGLSAKVARDSELIHVTFTHESPAVAKAVVNAVIRAYAEFHASTDGDDINQTLSKLRTVRQSLQNQRMQRQAQIQEMISSGDHTYSEMDELISQKAIRLQALEAEIRELEHLLAMADQHEGGRAINDSPPMATDPLTGQSIDERDLEAFDEELARLARAREDARLAMERVRERFFPRHRAYGEAEENLRLAERLYRERHAVAVRQFVSADRVSLVNWAMEPQQRIQQLRREAEQERAILASMQHSQIRLNDLRDEIEELQFEERETAARIRSLSIEADSLRRITVASLGEFPSEPAQDRRAAFAAIGAVGGFGASLAFFFALATLDRRVYGVAQLSEAAASRELLGVLPALPKDKGDIESSSVAAHCIHQIRNRIEALRKPGPSAVIAVSSPYQGDGKTSLTLALAASYAASGYRTLLVDCDMIGRSLTHNLMMTGRAGFQEAMEGDDVNALICELHVENLHVLPVGNEPSMGPERVRRSDLDVLFQRLRRHFDVVLVDTGPLIGSVESIPVASAADGVVLAMWRGRKQARLQECIKTMQGEGVKYLGVVLNYAMHADCSRYLSCSKTSAVGPEVNGSTNGKPRTDTIVSRNALLRAMQVTARSRPRRPAGSTSND